MSLMKRSAASKGMTCSGRRLSNEVAANNQKRLLEGLAEIKTILDDIEADLELIKQDAGNVERVVDSVRSDSPNGSYYYSDLLRLRLVRRPW